LAISSFAHNISKRDEIRKSHTHKRCLLPFIYLDFTTASCEIPIIFTERRQGKSNMSRKVQLETAALVWRLKLWDWWEKIDPRAGVLLSQN